MGFYRDSLGTYDLFEVIIIIGKPGGLIRFGSQTAVLFMAQVTSTAPESPDRVFPTLPGHKVPAFVGSRLVN